jgi:hypothetical protein
MEKILFLLAIIFAVLAISSRHHMKKGVEEANDSQSVEDNLAGNGENPASLTYALTKMSQPQAGGQFQRVQPPSPKPGNTAPKEDLNKLIQAIQLSNEDSPDALQKALTQTSGSDQLALKLTVIQAAMSIVGDNPSVRNIMMHEATSILIPENLSSDNPPPEEVASRDLQRNVVTTAYKVYLQTSVDADSAYNDTVQIMNFQSDPWVRRQISFEAINRFPQLREKLNGQ